MGFSKLVGVGSVSAAAFVGTLASTASPAELAEVAKIMPSTDNALMLFVLSALTYILKNGTPGKKDVEDQFGMLKEGHTVLVNTQRTLLERIEDLAFDTRSHRESTAAFREDLAEKIGSMSATLTTIDKRQENIEGRVVSLEKKVGATGTWPKPRV